MLSTELPSLTTVLVVSCHKKMAEQPINDAPFSFMGDMLS